MIAPRALAAEGTEIERHEAFRAALLALAYPGRTQGLALGARTPESAARVVLAAIFEPEQIVDSRDDAYPNGVALVRVGALDAADLRALPRGSEESPEAGATVIVVPASNARRTRVRLSGPGIESATTCELAAAPAALEARNEACASEPLGIDLLFVDAAGITGLPRTTRVEILD